MTDQYIAYYYICVTDYELLRIHVYNSLILIAMVALIVVVSLCSIVPHTTTHKDSI